MSDSRWSTFCARKKLGRSVPTIILATLLTTAVAAPAFEHAMMNGFATGKHGTIAAVRDYPLDPLTYLAQRSPGARETGNLIQSKHRLFRLPARHAKPHEQILANVRYPSALPNYLDDLFPPASTSLFEDAGPTNSLSNIGVVDRGGIPSSAVPVGIPREGAISPSGGSGGGAGGGVEINSSVPEPSTWAMMLAGMGAIGFAMRRRAKVSVSYA